MKSDVYAAGNAPSDSTAVSTHSRIFECPFRVDDVIADKYRVTGLVGTGGIGYVLSAVHLELGEAVALKFLRPEFATHPDALRRFGNEARSAAKIKSEHAVRVFDVGHLPNGAPFIVMELLEGRDLGGIVREHGRQDVEIAVEYALQVCEALGTAHACGIVHRDVKPDNLFLAKRPQGSDFIKVLDFGISKFAMSDATIGKQTTMAIGSPHYMSPEQVRAADSVDPRADIWSLGCVLYELLTGKAPFDGGSLMQISAAILESPPTPMRSLRPELSEELEGVVMQCLEKDPDRRFQDVGMLAQALVPFAPPSAHVWAERCSHMLDAAAVAGESGPASGRPSQRPSQTPPQRPSATALKRVDTQPISTSAVSLSPPEDAPLPPFKISRGLYAALFIVSVIAVGSGLSVQHMESDGSRGNEPRAAAGRTPSMQAGPKAEAPRAPPANIVPLSMTSQGDFGVLRAPLSPLAPPSASSQRSKARAAAKPQSFPYGPGLEPLPSGPRSQPSPFGAKPEASAGAKASDGKKTSGALEDEPDVGF